MAVTLTYRSQVTAAETLSSSDFPAVPSAPLVHSGFDTTLSLSATTTPPVTTPAYFDQALTAGAATIDLTALTHNGQAVNLTGLKVQTIKIKNPAGNAAMTFTEGASNGYALMGAGWQTTLLAGQEVTFYGNDATPDVAAGDRTIDITGTGTESCEIAITAG